MTTRDGMASTTTTSFKIHGMDCAEEVTLLREVVGNVVGDSALSFDIVNGKMTVASEVSAERVLEAVARTGMRAEVWQDDRPGPSRHGTSWVRNGRTLFTLASGLLSLAGFIVHGLSAGEPSVALGSEGLGIAHHVPVASKVLFILGILAGTRYVLPKAWFALKRLRPDMNLLMTIAVVGAVVIGEWFEAATVTFLFALSLALESWSVGRARRAVEALLDLSSPSARLKRVDGSEELVRLEAVSVGNRFVVMPGERIPLDGQVLSGASEVNQAPITGESMPTPKAVGDTVFAGTINGNGELEVECTKTAGDTTLAHIVRMVGEAQAHRSPSEQWVERFARIYTPVVMALALAVLLLPPLFIDGMWSIWSYRGLVLLVIACPCALVISTPVSIVAALAASAHHGVLVKSGVHMETVGSLKAFAFDKTGTLTEGRPAVVEVVPLGTETTAQLLQLGAALEARSDHPLAQAIVAHAKVAGTPIASAKDFRMIPGKGATARFDGKAYWFGSHRYLE
ncbi:MAG: cation-translocating P-type ATPase, partial [Planctomycetota bacterium]